MPIVTVDQVLAIAPGYDDDDLPYPGEPMPCNDKFAPVLRAMGYECYQHYFQHNQKCYVFQRDPWEAEIVIRSGQFDDGWHDYCASGNTEPLAA
jgi:hypothetical protein